MFGIRSSVFVFYAGFRSIYAVEMTFTMHNRWITRYLLKNERYFIILA